MNPYAKAIASLIAEISEDYRSSGWHRDIEYDLFAAIRGDAKRFTKDKRLEALARLCLDANGWVKWDRNIGEPTFVPLDKWFEDYNDRGTKMVIKNYY